LRGSFQGRRGGRKGYRLFDSHSHRHPGRWVRKQGHDSPVVKKWRVAKSSIQLASSPTDRRKILLIEGDPLTLLADLSRWLERQDP